MSNEIDPRFEITVLPDGSKQICINCALLLAAFGTEHPDTLWTEAEIELQCWKLRAMVGSGPWTDQDMESLICAHAPGPFIDVDDDGGSEPYYSISPLGLELLLYSTRVKIGPLTQLLLMMKEKTSG